MGKTCTFTVNWYNDEDNKLVNFAGLDLKFSHGQKLMKTETLKWSQPQTRLSVDYNTTCHNWQTLFIPIMRKNGGKGGAVVRCRASGCTLSRQYS